MLPDSVVSALRTSETAALAAAMIAGSFPEIASFAARVADAPHKVTAPDAPKSRRVPSAAKSMAGARERRPANARSG